MSVDSISQLVEASRHLSPPYKTAEGAPAPDGYTKKHCVECGQEVTVRLEEINPRCNRHFPQPIDDSRGLERDHRQYKPPTF